MQDEIRLHPDVTLSAGVRYELHAVARRSTPTRRIRCRASSSNDSNNIAPRLGITWRPFGSERTAVRGGYGLFYDTTSLGLVLNAAQINGRRILSYVVPGTDARAPQYPEPARHAPIRRSRRRRASRCSPTTSRRCSRTRRAWPSSVS